MPSLHPALVLLEFQRQWTDPGVYRRLLEPDLTRRNVVNAAITLAGVARTAGVPVVHAPLIVDPGGRPTTCWEVRLVSMRCQLVDHRTAYGWA